MEGGCRKLQFQVATFTYVQLICQFLTFSEKKEDHKSMIWDWLVVSCKLGIWSAFKLHIENWAVPQPFHKLTEIWAQRFVATRLVGTWYPSVDNAAKAILEPLLQSFVAYCPSLFEQTSCSMHISEHFIAIYTSSQRFCNSLLAKIMNSFIQAGNFHKFWQHIFWTRDFHRPYSLPHWIR